MNNQTWWNCFEESEPTIDIDYEEVKPKEIE